MPTATNGSLCVHRGHLSAHRFEWVTVRAQRALKCPPPLCLVVGHCVLGMGHCVSAEGTGVPTAPPSTVFLEWVTVRAQRALKCPPLRMGHCALRMGHCACAEGTKVPSVWSWVTVCSEWVTVCPQRALECPRVTVSWCVLRSTAGTGVPASHCVTVCVSNGSLCVRTRHLPTVRPWVTVPQYVRVTVRHWTEVK